MHVKYCLCNLVLLQDTQLGKGGSSGNSQQGQAACDIIYVHILLCFCRDKQLNQSSMTNGTVCISSNSQHGQTGYEILSHHGLFL